MDKEYLEKELVRHAYDSVIDRCARLGCFAGNLNRNRTTGDISVREKSLALDDIITLSISARRLMAVCGISASGSDLRVRKWRFYVAPDTVRPVPTCEYVALQKLFGIIIHCETLEILDSDLDVRLLFDKRDPTEYVLPHVDEQYFNPKIITKSDLSEPGIFDIEEIISCIDQDMLPLVIEVTENHGIYLDSFYQL